MRTKIKDCSAVVLAGGKNSRYGGFNKAFLRIDNKLIIEHHLELLGDLFVDVFVIANEVTLFEQFGVKVYEDIHKNRGPIAGIHTALFHSKKDAIMVFGCDMPNLNHVLINQLYQCWKENQGKYCVPKSNGHFEPLHALYAKETLIDFEEWLEGSMENALYKFLKDKDVCPLNITLLESAFININSPDDLEKLNKA